MKSLFLMGCVITLAGCGGPSDALPENSGEELVFPASLALAQRVKDGDTTVCADKQVTRRVLSILRDATESTSAEYLEASDLQTAMRKVKTRVEVVSVSAVDNDTGQISCDAQFVTSSADSSDSNPISYDIRPALNKSDGEFILQMTSGKDALLATVALVLAEGGASAQADTQSVDDSASADSSSDDTEADTPSEPDADDVRNALVEAQNAVDE